MSMKIAAGAGINVVTRVEYDNTGNQVAVVEVSIDPYATVSYGSSPIVNGYGSSPIVNGDVLTLENSMPIWKKPLNPLENDIILRENNIPLQQAWDTLMKALAEYEMTKKLTMNNELDFGINNGC